MREEKTVKRALVTSREEGEELFMDLLRTDEALPILENTEGMVPTHPKFKIEFTKADVDQMQTGIKFLNLSDSG